MRQDSILLEEGAGVPRELRPYIRLWAAAMRIGVEDFCTARARRYSEDHPYITWFNSDSVYPGSFVWLCHLFNMDEDKARSRVLMRWRDHVNKKKDGENGENDADS